MARASPAVITAAATALKRDTDMSLEAELLPVEPEEELPLDELLLFPLAEADPLKRRN